MCILLKHMQWPRPICSPRYLTISQGSHGSLAHQNAPKPLAVKEEKNLRIENTQYRTISI